MLKIQLVLIGAGGIDLQNAEIPENTSVRQALDLLNIPADEETGFAVFSKKVKGTDILKDGDRLEVSGKLLCDPKKVRKERALKQGDVRVVTCGRHGGRRKVDAK